MIATRGLLLGASLGALACSTAVVPDEASTWVGTISTEGNVTTVVNERGSVWGGDGRLVEQASIGVAEGPDEYMLGQVGGIAVTVDRIYVVDSQAVAVHAYDLDGRHIATLGRSGEGPGEYVFPVLVAADENGRAFVYDGGQRQINVYTPDGQPMETWPFLSARCCPWPMFAQGSSALWAPVQQYLDEGPVERRFGAQTIGPDGPQGPIRWVPDIEVVQSKFPVRDDFESVTPYSPWLSWSPTPNGGVIAGGSDRYRFEVHDPDGTTMIVERAWTPVPLPEGHRDWSRRITVASQRRSLGADWTWDGAEIPHVKPAYRMLIAAHSGEVWVVRRGPSDRIDGCSIDPIETGVAVAMASPCWTEPMIADVFGRDGRYLGSVPLPEPRWIAPSNFVVHGDRVVTVVVDDAGTVQVKRYRLEKAGV